MIEGLGTRLIPGSPRLHNFNVRVPERGSLGTRLTNWDVDVLIDLVLQDIDMRQNVGYVPLPTTSMLCSAHADVKLESWPYLVIKYSHATRPNPWYAKLAIIAPCSYDVLLH